MDCFEVRFPSKSDDDNDEFVVGFYRMLAKKEMWKEDVATTVCWGEGKRQKTEAEAEEDGSEEDSDNL